MAPELFSSETGYYTSVDWWSLGVVLFEMIFSDRPFRGKTKRENIVKGEYRMPNSKFSHLSTASRAFISDLLQLKLTNRVGCGLEGMKKFRQHAWFKTAWQPKIPKISKNAIAPVNSNDKPIEFKKLNPVKPIKWKKMNLKLVQPEFKPGDPVVFIRKRSEKDAEAERLKEQEKVDDMQEMISFQMQMANPSSLPAVREYQSLQEKFHVYIYALIRLVSRL